MIWGGDHILPLCLCWILRGLHFETCLSFPKFLLHGLLLLKYEVHLCMFTYQKHWGVGGFCEHCVGGYESKRPNEALPVPLRD